MCEVRWEGMFRDELEQAFEETPLLYVPYGICQPHGQHSALGLDCLEAHGIACCAAEAHGGFVGLMSYWHVHELGGEGAWSL